MMWAKNPVTSRRHRLRTTAEHHVEKVTSEAGTARQWVDPVKTTFGRSALCVSLAICGCGEHSPDSLPGILADLASWDAATPEARRAAASETERRESGFALLQMETFSCGGQSHEIAIFTHGPTGLRFVLIPAGTFEMGSPLAEADRVEDETLHRVTLTHPFLLSQTACTQDAYEAVMGATRFLFQGPRLPATGISWTAADAFCQKATLELPTEAEWEYACRAGTSTVWCFGEDPKLLGQYAWYAGNTGSNLVHSVAEKKPNAFGLFDVHGGVREWCRDWYEVLPAKSLIDPIGAAKAASTRVIRGGGWNAPSGIRSASRAGLSPGQWLDLGFRPAKTVSR